MSKFKILGISLTAVFIIAIPIVVLLLGAMLFIAIPTETTTHITETKIVEVDEQVSRSVQVDVNVPPVVVDTTVDVSPNLDYATEKDVNIANILRELTNLIALIAIIIGILLIFRNRSTKKEKWDEPLDYKN